MFQSYRAVGPAEEQDVARIHALVNSSADPFDRRLPLHLTGSAVVVDVRLEHVLLRWHERQHAWLQVGGHGGPGEGDPAVVALREAAEETGLDDLEPWPSAGRPIHVVIVPARGKGREPPHQHADIRYLLTTRSPGSTRPETPTAVLRWVGLHEAASEVSGNLAETLRRVEALLRWPHPPAG